MCVEKGLKIPKEWRHDPLVIIKDNWVMAQLYVEKNLPVPVEWQFNPL